MYLLPYWLSDVAQGLQQRITEIDSTKSYLNHTNYEIIQIRYKREQIAAKLFTKHPRQGLDDIVLGDHIRMRF